jgi:hypothetical protein
MSLLQTAIEKVTPLLTTVGQSGLNALYPNDFELYIISFELVDFDGNTMEFLALPIMPSNITISEPEMTNIKKTNNGVVSLKSESFVPKDITLTGNFGRNLKVLFREKLVDFTSFSSGLNMLSNEFDSATIKTGYGTTKILQKLLEGSKSSNLSGQPNRLYFYNFAFNENYVVECSEKSFTQSRDASNMIWNYNISLKAVAPITSKTVDAKSLINILSTNALQRGVNTLASKIKVSLDNENRRFGNTLKRL